MGRIARAVKKDIGKIAEKERFYEVSQLAEKLFLIDLSEGLRSGTTVSIDKWDLALFFKQAEAFIDAKIEYLEQK